MRSESGLSRPTLTMSQAAQKVGVSVATIRNWVKSGLLESAQEGSVSLTSVERVLNDPSKLKSRANKIRKDTHDHKRLTAKIRRDLTNGDADAVAGNYESNLSESYKNTHGIFYTPAHVIADMFKGIGKPEGCTFLDPCCGSGNFLVHAISVGFKPENVYGFDTDANAVAIAIQRIFERTGYASKNIKCADFLLERGSAKFDYILTNPPWGNKIEGRTRRNLGQQLGAGKSLDTSSLFFFKCTNQVADGGTLCMLLPEAFFNVGNFENARKKALDFRVTRLVDYGKVFKGLLTRAQAIALVNAESADNQISCESSRGIHFRAQSTFDSTPRHILNFAVDAQQAECISHLFSMPHKLLKDNAHWGLGIVTGDNQGFLRKEPGPSLRPVFRGKDIFPDRISDASDFIADDSRLQQVAKKPLYDAPEKLVYRFISSRLCFFADDKQRLMLNSANMLVLREDFPISHKQVAALLNSEVMNWLFRSVFNTRKVLRGDLERLPIYYTYFERHPVFDEKSYQEFLGIESVDGGFKKKSPAGTRDFH